MTGQGVELLKGQDMERLQRLLRLARLRGDRVAIAILETRTAHRDGCSPDRYGQCNCICHRRLYGVKWTESELRMMWGDR